MTDWKGLCEELLEAMASTGEAASGSFADLLDRARTALAEPVAERPTLLLPCPFCGSKNLRYDFCASQGCMVCDDCDAVGPSDPRAADPICDDDAAVAAWNRRAALARWGRPAPVPVEGEVAELVAWLRTISKHFRLDQLGDEADRTDRAANLLEQRHPAPVPVNERLPGPEDCDAEGRVWAWRGFDPDNVDDGELWQLIPAEWTTAQLGGGWTHWLPATALPLPQGGVE